MSILTPPLTPSSPFSSKLNNNLSSSIYASSSSSTATSTSSSSSSGGPRTRSRTRLVSSPPDALVLPPPMEVPELEMPEATLPLHKSGHYKAHEDELAPILPPVQGCGDYPWRPVMSPEEKDAREAWLSEGRGRKGLRIVIVTENFLPKVDGVTRTLARLLEHLEREGHSCMLLGPGTGMSHYASHPLVGTAGIPLVVYPGLKLNFLRPKFLRAIRDFQPDVVHFVDPIWLGAQTLIAMELGWAGEEWVSPSGPAIGTGINGAVVASYHTNLATYATLFGMAWLTPIMWKLQQWLYSKTLITLCPSPSTLEMLESQHFSNVRLWPRGVDLSQFGPRQRSARMRASWGVGEAPTPLEKAAKEGNPAGVHHTGRKASLPLTPPSTPFVAAVDPEIEQEEHEDLPNRIVLLYVGRVSWEKNLILLLRAYGRLKAHLPSGTPMPKLVVVGDGPARVDLENICGNEGYDATFMGHRQGQELAQCYASADVFAFPSFTETFGQVVLEALASGLPVVGLDAEGTRDLVSHGKTGLLLALPNHKGDPAPAWHSICRESSGASFEAAVEGYASLLSHVATQHAERVAMGVTACTEGIKGFTWWDAMERCVDGYRESIRMSRAARKVEIISTSSPVTNIPNTGAPTSPRVSRVNRALSSTLAHRGKWPPPATSLDSTALVGNDSNTRLNGRPDTAETLWHLKNLAKVALVCLFFWYIWTRHLASRGREPGWEELLA